MQTVAVFDVECDGLLDTVSTVTSAALSVNYHKATTLTVTELAQQLLSATVIVGHNILAYDLPVLVKLGLVPSYHVVCDQLHWATGGTTKVVDTLLLSQLLHGSPTKGYQHGLDAWGQRLGLNKVAIDDWSTVDQATLNERCRTDVDITVLVYKNLQTHKFYKPVYDLAYKLEAQFADCIAKQVTNGVVFDVELANTAINLIKQRMAALSKSVARLLPTTEPTQGELDKAKVPTKRFNADGTLNGMFKNWLAHRGLTLSDCKQYVLDNTGAKVFAMQSNAQYLTITKQLTLDNDAGMKAWLLTQGWVPEFWNYQKLPSGDYVKDQAGNKIPTSCKVRQGDTLCSNLQGLIHSSSDLGLVVKNYLAYNVYAHRLSSLEGMLKQPRVAVDGRLSAGMATLGAATGRVTHKVVANIPKKLNGFDSDFVTESSHGHVMRACFKAPDGYVMVGYDASALEARVEAHYVYPYPGGVEYGLQLLGDKPLDIHTINAQALGVSRDLAKSIKYALGYGAGVGKVQALLRCDRTRAQFVYDQYWAKAVCVQLLKDDLTKQWLANNKQYIRCIDGSLLYLGSQHLLLNYTFQSTGTKLMKLATVLLDNQLRKQGWYKDQLVEKVIDYHDEAQLYVSTAVQGLADHVGQLAVACVKQAGVYYKLNVSLDGEYLIGANWGATH